MSYALFFVVYLMSGHQYMASVKYFDSEQACIQQAAKFHYSINKVGAPILGTDHRCLPIVKEVHDER